MMNIIYIKNKRNYPKIQITNNLILYLDSGDPRSQLLNNTSTWTDLSGSGNNASWQNASGFAYGLQNLKNGKPTVFFNSATNAYFVVSNSSGNFSTNKGTVSTWMYINGSSTGRISGQSPTWEYGRFNESNFRFDLGGSNQIISNASWKGEWVNMCITWDSTISTSILYRNGSSSTTGTAIGSSSGNLLIGTSPGAMTQYINGSMGQFLFYNRVLSSTEVLNNYNTFSSLYI